MYAILQPIALMQLVSGDEANFSPLPYKQSVILSLGVAMPAKGEMISHTVAHRENERQ